MFNMVKAPASRAMKPEIKSFRSLRSCLLQPSPCPGATFQHRFGLQSWSTAASSLITIRDLCTTKLPLLCGSGSVSGSSLGCVPTRHCIGSAPHPPPQANYRADIHVPSARRVQTSPRGPLCTVTRAFPQEWCLATAPLRWHCTRKQLSRCRRSKTRAKLSSVGTTDIYHRNGLITNVKCACRLWSVLGMACHVIALCKLPSLFQHCWAKCMFNFFRTVRSQPW